MEDFGQELAVTKNDIRHLESDISEIKFGIEKIHTTMSTMNDRMDERYVRKEDFREHIEYTNKRFDTIKERNNMLIGSFLTLVVAVAAGYITKLFK